MRPILLSILYVGAAAAGGSASAAERPNIVLILADDLGKEWLSCYGSERQRTPALDRLAAGGMRFENAYATPLCTPTRVMLLTGRYPFRTGWVVHHDAPRWGGQYFDWEREITFARILRDAGYATVIAGKWQLNDLRAQPDALKRHGFDEHCVWPGFETGNPPSEERYFGAFIQTNGERKSYPDGFGPDITSDYLLDFIRRHRERPFLAYYTLILPHTPMTKTPLNRDTTAKGTDLHAGMVAYVDHLVGKLMQTLEELRLRERTLVIFLSDNGSPGLVCRVGGRSVVGGKGQLTEPGICVPFLVNWPGRVKAGSVTDELVDCSDVMPTLLDVAGVRPPAGVVLDGRSFASLLAGKADGATRREWIYSQLGEKRVVRDKRFKLFSDGRLYDLTTDPGEERDLSDSGDADAVAAKDRLGKVLRSLPADAKLPLRVGPPPGMKGE